MNQLKFYLILLIILFNHPVFSSSTKPPDWVINRPVNSNYYIGIGISNKNNDVDYIQNAKNNALKDLTSEIAIIISSNSVLYQYENNNNFKEYFESITKTSTTEELEEFEVVDSWEDEKKIWFYYRLSKAKYKSLKAAKLARAKNKSLEYLKKAKISEKNYEINKALIFYIKSYKEIELFLNEDLDILLDNTKIYLGTEIFSSIIQICSRINISVKETKLNGKVFSPINKPISINVKYASDVLIPLKNIPLNSFFSKGEGIISEKIKTDNLGNASCIISNIISKEKKQEIIIEIDLKEYLSNKSILFSILQEKNIMPYKKVDLDIAPLSAFFKSTYYYLDFPVKSNSSSINYLKNQLSKNFFVFTGHELDADIIIKVTSSIREGTSIKGELYDMVELFLSYSISITDNINGNEIYNKTISDIKSVVNANSSFENSIAILNKIAIKKIRTQILQELKTN